MPRTARSVRAGRVYHVLNRGNGRMDLFHKPADYAAFLNVVKQGLERYPVDLFSYCLMDNHWHLLLRPRSATALGGLMGWVGVTHVRRHHEHYQTRGGGHLYQGRFKAFVVQDDEHFLTVCRYIESNRLRAGLTSHAELWPHSSLRPTRDGPALSAWPVHRPRNWLATVNEPLTQPALAAVRACVNRGRPFGEASWVKKMVRSLGLQHTVRDPGRPRKSKPQAAPASPAAAGKQKVEANLNDQ